MIRTSISESGRDDGKGECSIAAAGSGGKAKAASKPSIVPMMDLPPSFPFRSPRRGFPGKNWPKPLLFSTQMPITTTEQVHHLLAAALSTLWAT